ncbi:MAG: DUF2461 domain-containing protein [Culturomica sp.]|jgi:uncharacterized protein (TIGR02453 family)|nr:DUF2461 domain-containing protein [Culturomica sp.]
MQEILKFLEELRADNNREWFEAHKKRYKELQNRYNGFVEKLIAGIARFDPSVAGLTVKECTYRIYRDVRFSPNKEPYKTHIGAYVCPKGKKSGYAGYYFHLEPGSCLITSGLYMPEPKVLKSVREDIAFHGEQLDGWLKKAEGFELVTENSLKRTPQGFPAGSPYDRYLRLKDLYVIRYFDDACVAAPDLLEKTLNGFEKTVGLVQWLNRAVDYAYEEM